MNTILLTTSQRLAESHDKHQFSLSKVFTVLLINLKIATSIKYHFNHQRLRRNIKYCHGEFPLYCRHSHRQWTKRALRDLCREDHLMPQKFLFILSFSPVAIAWPYGYVVEFGWKFMSLPGCVSVLYYTSVIVGRWQNIMGIIPLCLWMLTRNITAKLAPYLS